jgi:hypothetical protein
LRSVSGCVFLSISLSSIQCGSLSPGRGWSFPLSFFLLEFWRLIFHDIDVLFIWASVWRYNHLTSPSRCLRNSVQNRYSIQFECSLNDLSIVRS